MGWGAQAVLDSSDGYGFFGMLSGLIVTGPIRTNVNGFRAVLVAREHD